MDDVEKAILYTFDQSGRLDPSLKKAASAFADALKLRPDAWQLFLERFGATSYTEVQFWCLQGLHDFLRENYVSLPPEQRLTLKSALATWLLELSGNSRVLPSFAKNKLAQCLVVIVHFEFPDEWPTFFTDLITLAGQGPSAVDMFCRILTTVSEDIISLEIPRTQEDLRLSMHIKDSMRELCISQVAEAWFNLTVEYQHKDPTLAACVLRTMHLYINWIDIGLVANDRFVPMLFQLLSSGIDADLRGAAAECLAETLSKRMDPVAKLALIEKLNVIPMCTQWRDGFPSHGDEDLALNYARLLGVVAMELVESWKKVENPLISMKTLGFDVDEEASSEAIKASRSAARLLDLLFPALLMALHHPVDDVVLTTVPFFNAYLSRLKNVQRRTGAVPEASQNHVRNMLTGLAAGARYSDKAEVCAPSSAAANSINSDDEEDNMHTRRRELFLVFKNTSKLLPQVAIDMVGQKLQTVLAQAQPLLPDVEVAVTLLYELGEAALDEVNRPAAGAIGPMVLALMQADVPFSKHRIVAMPLLNTYVRYSKVLAVQEGQVLIPEVLRTFLDERGVGHPSRDVSTRACYLLSRFVKSLRPNLRSCAGLILQQLQPHLMTILKTPITDSPHQHLKGTVGSRSAAAAAVIDKGSCVDDRLYAFDAVGLLLGQVELPEADQATALKAEMALCMEQIQANLALASTPQALLLKPTPAALMQQALDALARLSKGISQNLATNQRPAVGQLFMEALELALVVPAAMPGNRALLQRFMSFLHCMVETVGTLTLPVLPRALELLRLPECDIPELCEAITVVNQLMLRFQSRLAPLLHQVTPVVVVRMHSLLRDDWDWSSKSIVPGGSPRAAAATPRGSAAATAGVGVTEDLRQRGELQKGYYSFLAAVTANELTPVLFAQPQHVLNAIVEALMKGASLHVDATTRKTCIQVLGKMLERGSSDEQLKTFMMERLGGEVCVAAVLGPGSTLDPRDGATYSLLMDIGLVLKALHAACGDRFISFLQEQVFPCLSQVGPGASQAAAEHSGVANGLWVSEMGNSLVQAIREGTADSVKKCMHVIMQQQRRAALQQQQQQQQP